MSAVKDFLRDPTAVFEHLLTWLTTADPAIGIALAGVAVAAAALRIWLMRRQHRTLMAGARMVTVFVPPTVDPAGSAMFWTNLVGLLHRRRTWWTTQPHVAFEYAFSSSGAQIALWVPRVVPAGTVERAVEAAWPGARTKTAPATETAQVTAVGAELRLARSEALPIRSDFAADPLRTLFGAAAGIGPHERVTVQILARPAKRLARTRSTSTRSLDNRTRLRQSAEDRAVVAKRNAPMFETRVRYAVTADHNVPQALHGRARAVASAFTLFSAHNHYRLTRLHNPINALNSRRLRRGDLLSIPELAALAHLPLDAAAPGLIRAGAKAVAPPPGVAERGTDIKPIGISDSGRPRPVGLRVADGCHHVHIMGATGSGKSELMARMILADAEAGRGLVVIDPKGDLVSDLLARLPEQVGPKVVLFDATSRSRPPVLNPLEGNDEHQAVDNLVSIFSRVYSSSWGPRTDDIFRAALLTLAALPGTPTLIQLPKLLTEPAFRERAVAHIQDEVLRGFWAWYSELSDASRAQIIAPLMNKLRGFLLRPFVRASIAGGPSTFDMDAVLNGGICLVRISRDSLGMETANLIGSIIVARTWQAAVRRARLPRHQRHPCGLYIDECHNFLNLPYPIEDMLAEARAYELSLTLAHQYHLQLTRELAEGISTNARSKIYFTASPEDARVLARHTHPRLNEHDIAHLPQFHVAARLIVNGQELPAFTAVTEKLPKPSPLRSRQIRKAAQANTHAVPAPCSAAPTADPRLAG
ncbi:DUF87 domain-containing protein [Lentzea sp. NPDC006480]|uniref:helicase HerA domain-containing protein n=1 Tax=Lentzea sp. NPDC006480 TaxID=3157176 RepID=UPI0033A9B8EB